MVLTGDYHLLCGDVDQALHCYRAAIRIAVSREEASWELRASLKIARLLAENKEQRQAADLLRPMLERYPGKDGKGDPQQAKALLAAL